MANSVTVSASEDQHRYALKLFQEGHYKEAAGVLEEILKSLETSQIWSDWATAQLMCGRAVESEQGYRRALEISPANARATGNLGVLLARTGRTAEAVPFLERAAAGSSEAERDELLRLAQICRNQVSVPNEAKSRSAADQYTPMSRSADLLAEAASNTSQPPAVAEPRPNRPAHPPGIYFQGIVYGGSGYAEEAWVEALRLSEHRIPVQLAPVGHTSDNQRLLPEAARSKLEALQSQTVDISRSVFYQAAMAHLWDMDTYGRYRVVRTMFETDRVPDGVPERCNAMDEVWVPSRFNLETYARAGVDERKLRLVPAGVDTQLFRPGLAPLRIPQKRGFNFLSVFDWQHRKGYDALLLAYLREFKPDEDVALILKVYQMNDAMTDLQAKIIYFAEREAGVPLEKGAPIILVNGFLPQKDMPRLYAAGDCFVLPTHGEGYGRPFLEALSCAVPVISTGWSGQMDFLTNENSYLIDYRLAPVPSDVDVEIFVGHQWAEPDVDHLRHLMRQAFSHREDVRKRGERGRADIVERYDWSVIMPRWVAEFQRLLN